MGWREIIYIVYLSIVDLLLLSIAFTSAWRIYNVIAIESSSLESGEVVTLTVAGFMVCVIALLAGIAAFHSLIEHIQE